MPEVSIIMPVYNKEAYISESIQSVLNQSFNNFELVIVNDGSTDHSLDIINQYTGKDQRIKVFTIQNSGVSAARNYGLKEAKGKWIQFLDGDDTICSDYLSDAIEIIKKQTVDILFSDFVKTNLKNEVVEYVNSDSYGIKNNDEFTDLFINLQYENGFFGFVSNKLISRELINKANASFSTSLKLAEDLDFYLQLYPFVTDVYFWNGFSFYYLQNNENYLANTDIDYFGQLKIQLRIAEWFQNIGKYTIHKNIIDKRIGYYVYSVLFDSNDKKEDLSKSIEQISAIKDIEKYINASLYKGFKKEILNDFAVKKYWKIKVLFKGRSLIRSVWRVFHGQKNTDI